MIRRSFLKSLGALIASAPAAAFGLTGRPSQPPAAGFYRRHRGEMGPPIAPAYEWTETHRIPAERMTHAFQSDLFALTGKANGATFRKMPRGQCRFMGVSGATRQDGVWVLTFHFAGTHERLPRGNFDALGIGG